MKRAIFHDLRDELNNAAATFAERVFDTGVEMLRERVEQLTDLSKSI